MTVLGLIFGVNSVLGVTFKLLQSDNSRIYCSTGQLSHVDLLALVLFSFFNCESECFCVLHTHKIRNNNAECYLCKIK